MHLIHSRSFPLADRGRNNFSTTSTLPAGITLGATTGILAGTPTVSGSFSIAITLTDNASHTTGANTYTLNISQFGMSSVSTGTQVLPYGTVGVAYSQTLSAPNCGTGCTWSLASGSLPGGLSMNASGVISGSPTGVTSNTFTVQAQGSNGTVTRVFALRIIANTPQPLLITTGSALYSSTIGVGYSNAIAIQGGTPPYTWTLDSGTMPPGNRSRNCR